MFLIVLIHVFGEFLFLLVDVKILKLLGCNTGINKFNVCMRISKS